MVAELQGLKRNEGKKEDPVVGIGGKGGRKGEREELTN